MLWEPQLCHPSCPAASPALGATTPALLAAPTHSPGSQHRAKYKPWGLSRVGDSSPEPRIDLETELSLCVKVTLCSELSLPHPAGHGAPGAALGISEGCRATSEVSRDLGKASQR